jgi:hypothetical protein
VGIQRTKTDPKNDALQQNPGISKVTQHHNTGIKVDTGGKARAAIRRQELSKGRENQK